MQSIRTKNARCSGRRTPQWNFLNNTHLSTRFSNFRSALKTHRFQRQQNCCRALAHTSCELCATPQSVKILIHTRTAYVVAAPPIPEPTLSSDLGPNNFCESSSHSSIRPPTPLSTQATASLLCSRKMCTAQSSTLLRKSTPLPNHSLRCFWTTPTAPTVAFLLRLAVDIHSTTVFLSPVISTSNPLVFVGGSSTMGVKISRLHASKFLH